MTYNNTFTSTKPFFLSSVVFVGEDKNLQSVKYICPDEVITLFDYGYLYSIELKRNEVKNQLSTLFYCEGLTEELDFLAANTDLLRLLPSLGSFISSRLNPDDKMSLELLKEGDDWQTLFINIYTTLPWEDTNSIFENFFDNLFELFPILVKKLNVNFIPL